MKKLINGIIDFRKNVRTRPRYQELFAKLALGQSPDTLMFVCSDSRVAPNVFASTDPGDLFVVRNVGNLIPVADAHGHSLKDLSEVAAVEFALNTLPVTNIIVCGHSSCGAMRAVSEKVNMDKMTHLKSWLKFIPTGIPLEEIPLKLEPNLPPHDRLSQVNVLVQILHLMSYPLVRERLAAGTITIHGWWFDIANAEVLYYNEQTQRFSVIDESSAVELLKGLK